MKLLKLILFGFLCIIAGFFFAWVICNKTADAASMAILKEAREMIERDQKVLHRAEEVQAETLRIQKEVKEEAAEIDRIKNLYKYVSKKNPKLTYNQGMGFTALVYGWCREEKIDQFHTFAYFQIENEFNLNRRGDGGKAAGPGQVWFKTWKLFADRFGFSDSDYNRWPCNTRVSIAFTGDLYRTFGSWDETIRRYNGGGNHREKESVDWHMRKYWAAYREITKFMEAEI